MAGDSTRPAMAARHEAFAALRDAYADEWAKLYDEARVRRGLKPLLPRKAERIAELRAELARLEGQA